MVALKEMTPAEEVAGILLCGLEEALDLTPEDTAEESWRTLQEEDAAKNIPALDRTRKDKGKVPGFITRCEDIGAVLQRKQAERARKVTRAQEAIAGPLAQLYSATARDLRGKPSPWQALYSSQWVNMVMLSVCADLIKQDLDRTNREAQGRTLVEWNLRLPRLLQQVLPTEDPDGGLPRGSAALMADVLALNTVSTAEAIFRKNGASSLELKERVLREHTNDEWLGLLRASGKKHIGA